MKAGWEEVTIKDIAVVDWGNTSLTKKAYVEGGEFLGVSASGCDGRMSHAEHTKNTPVLSAIGAQCGRMFLPKEDFTAIKNTITLTPVEGRCDPIFLFYLFNYVELPKRGAGQPFISKGDIQKFPVCVPPLEEQQRIVAILDEAFEGLGRAKANVEANLASAKELFEATLREEFAELAADWTRSNLAAVSTKIGSGATPRGGRDAYKSSGTSLIRSLNVYDREFRNENLAFIDKQQAEKLKNVVVEQGDVLLNITGASVARCCVAPDKVLPARVNQHVAIIRTKPEELRPWFLCMLLTSQLMKRDLLQIGSEGGATRQAITKRQIEALEVAFPSPLEQDAIVERLGDLERQCVDTRNRYQSKIAAFAELRQSLLAKAFAGELS